MKNHIKTIGVLIFLLWYCVPAQSKPPLNEYLDSARSEFVNVLYSKYNAFELCEAFSKNDDKKAFLNKVFETVFFSKPQQIKSAELFASHENATSRLHLGVVALRFKDRAGAEKIFDYVQSRKQEYFDKTKILTKYKSYLIGADIVFVYSETFLKGELKEFFGIVDSVFPSEGK